MQFDFLSLLLFAAALQAVLILVSLRSGRLRPSPARRLLSATLVSIAIILAHHVFYRAADPQWWGRYAAIGLSAAAWLAVPPSLYFYVRSLLQPGFRWRRRYW